MIRPAIAATFPRLNDPIGFAEVKGERVEIYPSETFIRLLEALYLRLGGPQDQVAEVAQVAAETQAVAETAATGVQTIGAQVGATAAAASAAQGTATQAQAAAASAAQVAAAKLDPDALTPLLNRLTALEGAVFP
jgi:hypothetical protein